MTLNKSSPAVPNHVKGWLLDSYPSDSGKIVVWVITEEAKESSSQITFNHAFMFLANKMLLNRLVSRLFNNQNIYQRIRLVEMIEPIFYFISSLLGFVA